MRDAGSTQGLASCRFSVFRKMTIAEGNVRKCKKSECRVGEKDILLTRCSVRAHTHTCCARGLALRLQGWFQWFECGRVAMHFCPGNAVPELPLMNQVSGTAALEQEHVSGT